MSCLPLEALASMVSLPLPPSTVPDPRVVMYALPDPTNIPGLYPTSCRVTNVPVMEVRPDLVRPAL